MGKGDRCRMLTVFCAMFVLASCGGDEDGANEPDPAPSGNGSVTQPEPEPTPPSPPPEPPNSAPTISGKPATTVVAGSEYRFRASASDADGDVLRFGIQNKPEWASFSATKGELRGTPTNSDVGTYSNIVIWVTDGAATAKLQPFSMTVEAIGLGSVTLEWVAPTERVDGTPLTDLAGFKVYWGTESRSYTQSVEIDNPAVTTYVVDNLGPGTYYFATTALTEDGLESDYSNEATKTIE